MGIDSSRKILVIDDNEAIHRDFDKILGSDSSASDFDELESEFFGNDEESPTPTPRQKFRIDHALQGEDGFELVSEAIANREPYSLAFVDMRMPPGWDGLETISHLLEVDPNLQVVICTAFSDHSWDEMAQTFGQSEHLLILKKPFDSLEIRQIASAMTKKWQAHRSADVQMEELHFLVKERTTEIQAARAILETTSAELDEARIEADRANQAKSDFLANISHELRTPLTAILGFAEMLGDPVAVRKAEERNDYVGVIYRNGRHLLQIINGILDLAKIEAGKMTLEVTEFETKQIVDEVLSMFRERANGKNLIVKTSIDPEAPPRMSSDWTRLKQVVSNLVANAIEFTQAGAVEIRISAAGDDRVEVRVADTGLGLSPNEIQSLFQPFSGSTGSASRRFGGAGLGLALSQRIATLLGGAIEVTSEEGVGCTFTLNVLASLGESHAPGCTVDRRPTSSARRDSPIDLSGRRVLLVEDGEDNRRLVSFILRKIGAEVIHAENGKIGIEQVEQSIADETTIDLVLMDMQMPVMDGWNATEKLRSMGCKIPIIALTAEATDGAKDMCLAAGCDAYLSKPINRSDLFDALDLHLFGEVESANC